MNRLVGHGMRLTPAIVVALTISTAAQAQSTSGHSNGNNGTATSPTVSTGNNQSNYYNNYGSSWVGLPIGFTSADGSAAAAWRREQNRQAQEVLKTTQKDSESLVRLAADASAKSRETPTDKTRGELMDELKKIEKLSHQLVQVEAHN